MKKLIINDPDIQQSPDGLIFNPFNPLNIEITLSDVQSILKNYGVNYNIDNINLYKRAFVHRSYVKRPAFRECDIRYKSGRKAI